MGFTHIYVVSQSFTHLHTVAYSFTQNVAMHKTEFRVQSQKRNRSVSVSVQIRFKYRAQWIRVCHMVVHEQSNHQHKQGIQGVLHRRSLT
jgi:hypothetical protein